MSSRGGDSNPSVLVTTDATVEGKLQIDHRSKCIRASRHRSAKTEGNIRITDETVAEADPSP